MAYSADSFVADEVPTTAKWNKLWTNDASFNDGTGIDDDAILARHISDAILTNAMLSTAAGEIGGAWSSYTPTVSAVTNSFSSASATGKHMHIGKTYFFNVTVTITTVGSGSGIQFTLPATAADANDVVGGYRERAIGGLTGTVTLGSTTLGRLNEYDNTQSLSNGMVFECFGTYEAA